MSKKFPQQGEIWLVDFNRQARKEVIKIRPALVMSNNWQNEFDKQIIVALITSDESKMLEAANFEVLIESSSQNGLDRKSKILLHRLQSIDKELRLIKKLGEVDSKIWSQVWKALWIVFTGKKID